MRQRIPIPYSLFSLPCSLFPVPCSLKYRNCVPHKSYNCYIPTKNYIKN
ncbi:MAG: hypothetical protein F6J90_35020 [Moorea sp. SIOASIH]|nr:hypothetical protein [Moorena sp. SIOASIH]NEO41261.1 hypothetical protein [Moorena sp. SIOASIH]